MLTDTVRVRQAQFNLDSMVVSVLSARGIKFKRDDYSLRWQGRITLERTFKESDQAMSARFASAQAEADSNAAAALGNGVAILVEVKTARVEIDNLKGTVLLKAGLESALCPVCYGAIQGLRMCCDTGPLNGLRANDVPWMYGCLMGVSLSDGVEGLDADGFRDGWFKILARFELVPHRGALSCGSQPMSTPITADTRSASTSLCLDLVFRGLVVQLDTGKRFPVAH